MRTKETASGPWASLSGWWGRLLTPAAGELRGIRGVGIQLARIAYFSCKEFTGKFCWERAGSLAFTTLVSLIPLSVIFMSFVGMFWDEVQLRHFVLDRMLVYLVPDEKLRSAFADLLTARNITQAFRFQAAVNLLAAAGLVIAGAALLVSAERVFNRLWDVTITRSYFQKLVIFWIILTTSPVALAASLYFDQLTGPGTAIGDLKRYWILDTVYSYLVPTLISFIAFTILNVFLPNTRVHLRPAMLGALVAALLWEGAKQGFQLYLLFTQNAQNLTRFFGSLGILPVFLFWVYICWLIILLGVLVTRTAQNLPQLVLAYQRREVPCAPPASLLAVYLLARIFEAFEAKAPPASLEDLAPRVGVQPEILEPMAATLVEKGILVEDGRAPGRFVPARPAGSLRLREAAEVFSEDLGSLAGLPAFNGHDEKGREVYRLFLEARGSFLGSLGDRTFADLVASGYEEKN